MSVSCMLHTFLKYRDHYTSNIIVAAPMQRCNYYIIHVYTYTIMYVIVGRHCVSLASSTYYYDVMVM